MIGAIFGIFVVSALIHLSISWIGKRLPQVVHFVEDFSGTILIYCILSWVNHMETTDRNRPSMFFMYAALYFLFVFVSKLSGTTFYDSVPPRTTKIPLRAEFALFLCSLITVRIFSSIVGGAVSADNNAPAYLLLVILTYYLLERAFIKHKQASALKSQKTN